MAFAHFVNAMLTLETNIPKSHIGRMKTIGVRIREARERLGLTQQQLADRVGVDQSTVSGWERDDKRRPARDLMPSVARALGRTAEWLEGREGAGLSDRARSYDIEDAVAEPAEENLPAGEIDETLLAEVIRMAMRNLLARYGVDIPEKRFTDAADAAAASYQNYFRLRRSG